MSRVWLLALAAGLASWPRAGARAGGRPDLEQKIGADQKVVTGEAVLSRGHVDIGPRFVDGQWTLLVARRRAAEPRARLAGPRPDRVPGARRRAVCRCPTTRPTRSSALRPAPTSTSSRRPRTTDVVWVGWNTQDPEVMETIDRGVTLTLDRRPGAGPAHGLPPVRQLRRARGPVGLGRHAAADVGRRQHAHARQLGVHRAGRLPRRRSRIEADLVDGRHVTDTRELRFAVGVRRPRPTRPSPPPGAASDRAAPAPTPAAAEDGGGSGAVVAALSRCRHCWPAGGLAPWRSHAGAAPSGGRGRAVLSVERRRRRPRRPRSCCATSTSTCRRASSSA